MRLTILTQYYPPEVGAPQTRLSSMATELQRLGHTVRVVTALPSYPTGRIFPSYRGVLWRRESIGDVPVLRTAVYPSQSARMVPRLGSYLTFATSALCTLPWIRDSDCVFVESPPLFLGVSGLVLARAVGADCLLNVSDLWPKSVLALGLIRPGLLYRAAEYLERFLYDHSDFVVAVTDGIRESLLARPDVAEEKVLFLPNGVDTELFAPRAPDRDLAISSALGDRHVFLFAGTLGHAQDLGNVIGAAARLRHRPDIAIALVGDGPVKREMQALAVSERLENVRFFDPQPLSAMPSWWSLSRAAIVTLRDSPLFEGARPSKSFPALASGVPIIYAGRGEMAQILDRAGAGICVSPGDPEALATAIVRLADDDALVQRLRPAARSLAEADFSWRRVVATWLEQYSAARMSPTRARCRS